MQRLIEQPVAEGKVLEGYFGNRRIVRGKAATFLEPAAGHAQALLGIAFAAWAWMQAAVDEVRRIFERLPPQL